MYIIKQTPEDFIVIEKFNFNLNEEGGYSYFWMTKKNYTTIDAVKAIASRFNIPLKDIGFAGAKDRQALTKQAISIKNARKELEDKKFKDIKLEFVGYGNNPISLGDLEGNEFRIVVRNLTNKRIQLPQKFPNYFGPQRFSKNNAEIGKAIIKKNFQKAAELVDQQEVKDYLETYPVDFIGALRKISLKTRKIYVHAYQSLLWNNAAHTYMSQNPHKNIKIPVIGFQTEIDKLEYSLQKIINQVMSEEGISTRDFILPQIKELSSEGGERDLFVKPENLEISIEKDELNDGKLKAIVLFSLPKASYATIIIDSIFQ